MNERLPKKTKARRERALPRWAIPLVWFVLVGVILVVLPWAVSRLGPRFGWSQGIPATWNLAGLIGVAFGLTFYVWSLVFHFKSYRASVRIGRASGWRPMPLR